jgi:xanthine/uracil permease
VEFRYGLDQRPPLSDLLLYGLQWLAIAVPSIIIIGRVVAPLYSADWAGQVLYLQKLTLVTAVTLGVQVLWGHRLPLICGPAAVLLVGVMASRSYPPGVVYGSILAGGVLLTLLAICGLFQAVARLFTPRVVATVLLLIAFTLLPTIRDLVTAPGGQASPLAGFVFATALVLALYAAHHFFTGVWKTTLIVWGVLVGTAGWRLLFPAATVAGMGLPPLAWPLRDLAVTGFALDIGVLVAFLFCFLALAINDLGSIQSLIGLLRPAGMAGRVRRGMTVTGLGNLLAGTLGVLGPVNFSLSPGVVAATGCASRFVFLPVAAVLVLLACSPLALAFLGAVPPAVVGGVLLYILCSQVGAGLLTLFDGGQPFRFDHGLVLGLPLLLGTLVAFLPPEVTNSFPAVLRPVLGNGFLVGTLTALVLEHGLIRPDAGP